MPANEIIDVDLDTAEVRRSFWRKALRYGLPCASIVLIAAGLIGTSLYTSAMNKTDVLALSRGFIDALNQRVLSEVGAYLDQAGDAAATLSSALPPDPLSAQGRALFENMARDLLSRHAQIAALFIGTPDGEFLMVRRNAAGTADTKLIRRSPGGVASTWTRRDSKGKISGRETNQADPYDPRTRSWFRDASENSGIRWSQVYIFFTAKAPGITASTAVRRGKGRPIAVVGADINLNSLSGFLKRLQKQARGQLAIVNGDGQLVAFHDPSKVVVNTGSGLRPRTVRELGLPVMAEAFDRLRVEGPKNTIVEIDANRHIFGASSLRSAVARDWWLMLLAPENAYLGFVTANSQRAILASSAVILLTIVLAGFLTYQGVVADRNTRALRGRQQTLETQRQIFRDLGNFSDLPDPTDQNDLRLASETLARAQHARRVSFWRMRRDGLSLTCVDAFHAETNGHTEGAIIHADNCGDLFSDLSEGRRIEIPDVANNPRSAELNLTYLQSAGTTALVSIPAVLSGQVLGAIWIEDPNNAEEASLDRSVVQVIANILAARFFQVVQVQTESTETETLGLTVPAEANGRRQTGALPSNGSLRSASVIDLRRDGAQKDGLSANASVFPGASVLTLKFLDDHALASDVSENASGNADGAVMGAVFAVFEDAATAANIPYVKILTDQILAVDGFDGDTQAAAERLVGVALSVREQCASIFLASGRGPEFSLGMDSGSVYGAALGDASSPYNVWGDAMRIANILADTAEPGTIQASEATYELLRGSCVFRRRGAFYLDRLGEMTTFTLRGQL